MERSIKTGRQCKKGYYWRYKQENKTQAFNPNEVGHDNRY